MALVQARKFTNIQVVVPIVADTFYRLIAIMLGRLRMTVLDCIKEYESLGGKIFGKPRFLTELHFPIITTRAKYDATKLKDIFEDVTRRRDQLTKEVHRNTKFPSERDLCRTLVLTLHTSRFTLTYT